MASILEYDEAAHDAALLEEGYDKGVAEEQANTEAERKRADAERNRADAAELRAKEAEDHAKEAIAELERYKEKYGELAEA